MPEAQQILAQAKRWNQDAVALPCTTPACKGRLLVVGQVGSGGACGSSISIDIEYAHACPRCLATARSSKTLNDDDF